MKKLFVILCLSGIILNTTACNNHKAKRINKTKETDSPVKYHCPMHPSAIFDEPGDCPKCGMKLIKMEAKKGS